ncbi:UNVERIFIED_CONTAM: putative sulfate transporter 3.3 [Sesamum indicum]
MEPNSSDHREAVEIAMETEVHRVAPPPHRSTLEKLRTRLKETFFPDDPLRQFKGQSWKVKLILGAQYIFPILEWGPKYSLTLLKSDIVSGLTIASLAIPQGISYAKLANLPPIVGLYSSFVPPLIYAVLGSSRDLAVGPVSIASLIMGSMLRQVVSPAKDPILFLQLAFSSTFFAGLFQASLGFLRLGFIIDFLSKATLIGFMAGAAIIVSLQQLKSLLGITHFTKKMGIVPVLTSVFHNTHEWSWETILMGFCFLVFLLLARHISMKKPKLFWVSAGAPLLSVILSTLLVFAFKAQNHGISVIGKLQEGLNPPSWNMLHFHGSYLGLVMKTGLITGIISLTEGIAVGRTFAALKNYQVDGNKEMIAIGLMNIVGSSTSCYVTTGAFSRSAVNHNAGCKTAVSNIIMAVTVMVTLLFLMPLFQYTPNVVLGAIIVTAVVGLIDIPAACQIWKIDKFDFLVMLCAFLGVLFISVQEGLAIAVGISVFKVLLQITRPKTVILGNIPGTDIYRNLHHYKEAVSVPGFLILSIEAPINFANTTYLKERITRWIEEYETEDANAKKKSEVKFVILDLSAVSAIDTNGVSFFKDLKMALEKKNLEAIGEVIEKLQRADDAKELARPDCLFLTVGEAVTSLVSTVKSHSSSYLIRIRKPGPEKHNRVIKGPLLSDESSCQNYGVPPAAATAALRQDCSLESAGSSSVNRHVVLAWGDGEGRTGITSALLLSVKYEYAFSGIEYAVHLLSGHCISNAELQCFREENVFFVHCPKLQLFGMICRWSEWDAATSTDKRTMCHKSSDKPLEKLKDVGQQLARPFKNEESLLAVGGEDYPFKENWNVKLNASSPKKIHDGKVESTLDGANFHTSVKDEVFGFCRFSRTTKADLVLLSQQSDVSLLSSEQHIFLYEEMFLAIEVLSSFLHTQVKVESGILLHGKG